MLNKTLSFLIILGLAATTNFSVLAQSQSSEVRSSQSVSNSGNREFLLKLGIDRTARSSQLLDADSFSKVEESSLSRKAMQDADKAQQKNQQKKFAGLGTTTAIIIGAGLAAAIIIVLATKGNKRDNNSPCRLSGTIIGPCPPGCVCIQ